MKTKEIIEMARQAGGREMVSALTHPNGPTTAVKFHLESGTLETFAKLVEDAAFKRWAAQTKLAVQEEREACAEICDRFQARDVGMQPAECAGAIRARSISRGEA